LKIQQGGRSVKGTDFPVVSLDERSYLGRYSMTRNGILGHLTIVRRTPLGSVLIASILLTLLSSTAARVEDEPNRAGSTEVLPLQAACSSILLEHRGKSHHAIPDFFAPAPRRCVRQLPGRLPKMAADFRTPSVSPLSSRMLYTQTTASDL
jgi:hypothetical protein